MAHAECGPSYLPIAMACPASVTLARGKVGVAGPAARDGTAKHIATEMALQGKPIPPSIEVDGHVIELGPDALDAIDVCVNVAEMIRETSDTFELEKKLSLEWLTPPEPVFGTTDCVAWKEENRLLTVADWKFGRIDVRPDGPQNMAYSLMAAGEIGIPRVKAVRLVIVQPALGDRAVKAVEISIDALMRWADEELMPALERIAGGDTTEIPGDHCKYCRRGSECQALQRHSLAVARKAFDDDPLELTDDEAGAILSKAAMIEAWIEQVRALVDKRLREGNDVPGWKLVPKKARRAWADMSQAEDAFAHLGPEAYVAPVLKSPAQMERVLKNAGFDPKTVEPLVTRESSGTTLVPATDPREAVRAIPPAAYFD